MKLLFASVLCACLFTGLHGPTHNQLHPAAADLDIEALERQVRDMVNAERDKQKIAPLKSKTQLVSLSRAHSADMAIRDYVAHINPEGHSPTDRARIAKFECKSKGYNGLFPTGIGENIFMSYLYSQYKSVTINGVEERTYDWKSADALASEIVGNWMQSQGHRENILRKDYLYGGIGIATNLNHQIFVTQTFC
ncbi:MAG: CAP domain-containing protein [Bacteroidota bacterium]